MTTGAKATHKTIPVTDIAGDPANPRISTTNSEDAELGISIEANGILQPLLVRPAENGRATSEPFMVVCGHRRLNAAKHLGLEDVPCVVRKMTDAEARAAQIVENSQRENLHPLGIAEALSTLLEDKNHDRDEKHVFQDVSAALGKSVRWVRRVYSLNGLIEELRNWYLKHAYTNQDTKIKISDDAAILLSGLSAEVQRQAADWIRKGFWKLEDGREYFTIDRYEVRYWLEDQVERMLDGAPWRRDDTMLVEEAGSCAACPKRTGAQIALFEDYGATDKCLDPSCFKSKVEAHYKEAKINWKRGGGKLVPAKDARVLAKGESHPDWLHHGSVATFRGIQETVGDIIERHNTTAKEAKKLAPSLGPPPPRGNQAPRYFFPKKTAMRVMRALLKKEGRLEKREDPNKEHARKVRENVALNKKYLAECVDSIINRREKLSGEVFFLAEIASWAMLPQLEAKVPDPDLENMTDSFGDASGPELLSFHLGADPPEDPKIAQAKILATVVNLYIGDEVNRWKREDGMPPSLRWLQAKLDLRQEEDVQ